MANAKSKCEIDKVAHVLAEFERTFEAEIDAKLAARLKGPFTYEALPTERRGVVRYRIADKNDDPIASTHEEVYAKILVDALNNHVGKGLT